MNIKPGQEQDYAEIGDFIKVILKMLKKVALMILIGGCWICPMIGVLNAASVKNILPR